MVVQALSKTAADTAANEKVVCLKDNVVLHINIGKWLWLFVNRWSEYSSNSKLDADLAKNILRHPTAKLARARRPQSTPSGTTFFARIIIAAYARFYWPKALFDILKRAKIAQKSVKRLFFDPDSQSNSPNQPGSGPTAPPAGQPPPQSAAARLTRSWQRAHSEPWPPYRGAN